MEFVKKNVWVMKKDSVQITVEEDDNKVRIHFKSGLSSYIYSSIDGSSKVEALRSALEESKGLRTNCKEFSELHDYLRRNGSVMFGDTRENTAKSFSSDEGLEPPKNTKSTTASKISVESFTFETKRPALTLERAGIENAQQILNMKYSALLKLKGMGRGSADEIVKNLIDLGLIESKKDLGKTKSKK